MSKKLLSSITLALVTALTTTAAIAAPGAPAATKVEATFGAQAQGQIMVADRRGNDSMAVLDTARVGNRAGSLVLQVPRGNRSSDLALVSSDARLDLGRIVITYANGRSTVIRGSGASAIDLPDGGRITSIRVQYQNRSARGATVKLVARAEQGGRDGRGDHGGRGHGGGRGR